MDMKLELVPLPVSDVDAAKAFYSDKLGFHVDLDVSPSQGLRVVQLTPPGSACSICFGSGVVDTPPGSVQLLHLVVPDIRRRVPSSSGEASTSRRSTTRAGVCSTRGFRTRMATAGRCSSFPIRRRPHWPQ
jgi:hypothetical protein